jgi:uncharacterized membrane protein YciS (DUF1049 family)
MERICKLPFILGCLAAMTVGIASYAAHIESHTIYLRMTVMMLVFFIIGWYIKNTVFNIEKEIQDKKLEQEKEEEQQQLNKLAEEQKASASASKHQPSNQGQAQRQQTHKLDLTAEDTDDDFEPLAISRAISSKTKE